MYISKLNLNRDLRGKFAEIGRKIAERSGELDKSGGFDLDGWKTITDAGLWRIPITPKEGGIGGTWYDYLSAMEGLASTAQDLGFLVTVLGHIGALRILLTDGTVEQKNVWLEPLLNGEIGITAMTESAGGSDLARMRLLAEPHQEGWILNGRKVHITNGPIAKLGLVAGRVPSLGAKHDITLFYLNLESSGISRGDPENNLGMRTSPTSDLIFDNVLISPINIMGGLGNGLEALYKIIAFERALYGVIASGLIGSMLTHVMERVMTRQSFGKVLADHQYVQGRVTDMKIAELLARLLSYASLEELENKEENASILCSITKFFSGEKLLMAAENYVQLFGHYGFMDNSISRMFRDAIGMRIAGGTSDIQRINIFNQMRRAYTHTMQANQESLDIAAVS